MPPSWGPCVSGVLTQLVARSPAEMLESSLGVVPLTVLDNMASGETGLGPPVETIPVAEALKLGWVRLRLGPVFQAWSWYLGVAAKRLALAATKSASSLVRLGTGPWAAASVPSQTAASRMLASSKAASPPPLVTATGPSRSPGPGGGAAFSTPSASAASGGEQIEALGPVGASGVLLTSSMEGLVCLAVTLAVEGVVAGGSGGTTRAAGTGVGSR